MEKDEFINHYKKFFSLSEAVFEDGQLILAGDLLPIKEEDAYQLIQEMTADLIEMIMSEPEDRRYPALLATFMSFFEFGLYMRKILDQEYAGFHDEFGQ